MERQIEGSFVVSARLFHYNSLGSLSAMANVWDKLNRRSTSPRCVKHAQIARPRFVIGGTKPNDG